MCGEVLCAWAVWLPCGRVRVCGIMCTFAAERGDERGAARGGAALGSTRLELRGPLDGGEGVLVPRLYHAGVGGRGCRWGESWGGGGGGGGGAWGSKRRLLFWGV